MPVQINIRGSHAAFMLYRRKLQHLMGKVTTADLHRLRSELRKMPTDATALDADAMVTALAKELAPHA